MILEMAGEIPTRKSEEWKLSPQNLILIFNKDSESFSCHSPQSVELISFGFLRKYSLQEFEGMKLIPQTR